jgi:hypothetical protein
MEKAFGHSILNRMTGQVLLSDGVSERGGGQREGGIKREWKVEKKEIKRGRRGKMSEMTERGKREEK